MIEIAAITASIVLFCLAIFQLLLANGAPYGKYAWGGTHTILPNRLRIASLCSIVLYIIFAVTILSKAGMMLEAESRWVNVFMRIFSAYFIVGIFMNGISRSQSERAVMTPVAIVLSVCFLYVIVS